MEETAFTCFPGKQPSFLNGKRMRNRRSYINIFHIFSLSENRRVDARFYNSVAPLKIYQIMQILFLYGVLVFKDEKEAKSFRAHMFKLRYISWPKFI